MIDRDRIVNPLKRIVFPLPFFGFLVAKAPLGTVVGLGASVRSVPLLGLESKDGRWRTHSGFQGERVDDAGMNDLGYVFGTEQLSSEWRYRGWGDVD